MFPVKDKPLDKMLEVFLINAKLPRHQHGKDAEAPEGERIEGGQILMTTNRYKVKL